MKRLFLLIALFSTLLTGCTENMLDNLKGLINNTGNEQPNTTDPRIPHTQIWYTSSDGYAVEPYCDEDDLNHITLFGANIISNKYDADKECWVIMFDDNVTTIGENAFVWCDNLTSIIIPNSVTSIGNEAFIHCSNLTSITIPNSVTSIGVGAFFGCIRLAEFRGKYASKDGRCLIIDGTIHSFAPAELTEYTIQNSATSIGEYAFSFAYDLTSVTIPDSITTIGMGAFYSCDNLTSITIPNSVTSIGVGAFYYCCSLTSATIPDSVTEIGDAAFACCDSLNEFKGKYASKDGRCLIVDGTLNSFAPFGLTSYTIPDSVTTIGSYAFEYCSSLTSITIPESVTTIGDCAFYNCSSLTSITIPDSVTSIGSSTFSNCRSLTSITIPDSVTTIGDSAFEYCRSLTSITIPDSVTTIGESAFYDCSSLTSVTMGDSVTSIGYYAFFGCKSLVSVYCKPTTPPSGHSDMFSYYDSEYIPIGCTIYVPTESVEAYKSADGWSDYADAIVGYDFE